MKTIVWRSGKYKYREASFAYINEIRVAVITPLHDNTRFDAKLLLPGLPKGTNSFRKMEGARSDLETRVEKWFEMVAQ